MPWQPGQRILTADDHADWQTWRRERMRQAQRERRAKYRRIDYYPDDLAIAVIDGEVGPYPGGDFSTTISRIVVEWAALRRDRN